MDLRERLGLWAGMVGLVVYTLGVVNSHATALRQIGYYLALVMAALLIMRRPAYFVAVARRPLGWALAALSLAALASVAVSPDPGYSATEAYIDIGRLVLSALATAMIVRRPGDALVLLVAAVLAAWLVSLHDILLYVREFFTSPTWPSANVHQHRYFADPLLWFLPASLWVFTVARGAWVPWATAGLVLYWLLLAGTGARAAWYGGIGVAAVWFALYFDRRKLLLAAAILGLAVLAALWLLPPEIFSEQVRRGVDTSHRLRGAWMPALEMILESPWVGFGYGQDVFHAAYNARAPAHPEWYFRSSVGPHNVFLALWFAGGALLLASVLATLFAAFAAVLPAVRRGREADLWRAPLAVAACSLLGYVVVRGMFESLPLHVAGLALGLALAAATARAEATRAGAADPGDGPGRAEAPQSAGDDARTRTSPAFLGSGTGTGVNR